jgi:6-phosphogluconolactonase
MKFARSISSILVPTVLSACIVFAQGKTAAPKQVGHNTDPKRFFLYIGTFIGSTPGGHPDAKPPSKGIYMARFDAETGTLSEPVLTAELANPTFMAISSNQRFLYAITESDPEAFVTSYAIDPHTGGLRMLNRLPTGGSGTAYLSLDGTGRFILLAHYGSASVTVIQIDSDGSLGKLTSFVQHSARRSAGGGAPPVPRPHAAVASPDNRFVVVPDLGLNKIFVYKFDAENGVLAIPAASVVDLTPEDGPRHFLFSADGKFGYMIGQASGNVEVFRWDQPTGTLSLVQTAVSFPKGLDATNMSAEIGITPNGRFLYESNRRLRGPSHDPGPDSIVAYQVNQETGVLTKVQDLDMGGSIPRCFSIDPTGGYMVVGGQQTNRVDLYRIDHESGKLSNSGVSIPIHTPACMQFVPAGAER